MEYVPNDVRFAVSKMTSYNRNTLRLETHGTVTANPGQIVTVTLPSNAILDLRSFRVTLDVATQQSAVAGQPTIFAKTPSDSSSLIQQMEVYCSGVMISNSFSEFNTVSKIKQYVNSSRDRNGSIDGALYKGYITEDDDVEAVSMVFKPLIGLFAESSTRYLPTSLCGDVTVRLTLASNAVLAFKEQGTALCANFVGVNADTRAASLQYEVASLHAQIDTVSMSDTYEQMLLDRLSGEDFLPINYKDYQTFALHGTTTGAHDVRFSMASSSIDRIYAVIRDNNYAIPGVVPRVLTGANFSNEAVSNYFHFKAFNTHQNSRGQVRYQYQINGIMHPVYRADCLDALHECLMISDQHGNEGRGNMISSLQDWNYGKGIFPLQLSKPGEPINVQSGYNSKGATSAFNFSISGQNIPAAIANSQVTAAISTLIVCEVTNQMRITGAKSVSIAN